MKQKNIQIPFDLFIDLVKYFCAEDYSREESIRIRLEEKLNSAVNHELYTKSKTAPTAELRQTAMNEYIDSSRQARR